MTNSRLTLSILLFGAVFFISTASAGMIDKEGMDEWEICAMCHNVNGLSSMAKFPKLAGQKAAYIRKQFLDFYHGRRNNGGGQMEAIATEVDLSAVDSIATYFAQLPPPVAKELEPDADSIQRFSRGEQLFYQGRENILACASCHDPLGYSHRQNAPLEVLDIRSIAPWLFAQHEQYLVKQLQDFSASTRSNEETGTMHRIAQQLNEESIRSVAFYLAREQPIREE